ncbi:GNAT family N-acetyltransferase [Fulvivirga lutimaris]|uniref:GNAT family N-acetyltransferase n=1 Tax=Fulvivirga lutimaris TaxID=1819566 RepID=UPI0012BCD09E|nr:GNAT family N-acetyltransferase [Fulvivirga lutimaris]MTI39833.1 N-acetyltransferase [Fulvivirga lutimaris]
MQIVNNKTNGQFETIINGHKAELQYRIRENTIFYMHTGVPKELERQGVATALAKFGLDYARMKGYQIVVYCPFVVKYVKSHKEYLDLLNDKFQKPERFN